MKITDDRAYKIQIYGQMEAEDISSFSPFGFKLEHVGETNTLITLRTDQSGLIGLIRNLHGMGLMLISISCNVENLPDPIWTEGDPQTTMKGKKHEIPKDS